MATNAKENVQLKSRQTKLMKKSNEELVGIVLKKDNLEKKLNSRIASLKAEVNTLTDKLNIANNNCDGYVKTIAMYKDVVNTKQETIDNLSVHLHDAEVKATEYYNECIEMKNKVRDAKNLLIVVGMALILSLFGWLSLLI